jgi:hypothetical protein
MPETATVCALLPPCRAAEGRRGLNDILRNPIQPVLGKSERGQIDTNSEIVISYGKANEAYTRHT